MKRGSDLNQHTGITPGGFSLGVGILQGVISGDRISIMRSLLLLVVVVVVVLSRLGDSGLIKLIACGDDVRQAEPVLRRADKSTGSPTSHSTLQLQTTHRSTQSTMQLRKVAVTFVIIVLSVYLSPPEFASVVVFVETRKAVDIR